MRTPGFSMMEYAAIDVPFAEELRIFKDSGADAVALSLFRPPRGRRESLAEMAGVLRESGLPVTYCWPDAPSVLPIPGFPGSDDWRARVAALISRAETIATFGALGMGCVTGPAGGQPLARAWDRAVEGFREVTIAAQSLGIRVAIEPIHPDESELFSFVTTIPETARLIADIGMPNVGIIADFWHLDGRASVFAELEEHAALVDVVHVCDRRDPTRSGCDRVLPGDGITDVAGMIGALERSGYAGYYELEVLSDDGTYGNDFPDSLWRLPPGQLVAAGRAKFLACYQQALTSPRPA